MSKFKIEITSVPDRDNLVAEIWFEQNLIAEVNQEDDINKIILYNIKGTVLQFDDFLSALVEAKRKMS